MYDWWMVNFGNRIATFLLVLETATKGGGTIFPYLDITIMPEAGDAILWFNMQPDGTRAHTSLHGACPIREGRKVAATLWVRVRGQEFMAPCPSQPTVAYELEPFLARI
uniref:Prolyl 4-hydroxylase alpha subunit Fe(2+) 2OG dioxygenase domain-containing protein n=1 Tax=Plectus sambesii TaxID=2011161 RepID=A0A914V3P3_9BILA